MTVKQVKRSPDIESRATAVDEPVIVDSADGFVGLDFGDSGSGPSNALQQFGYAEELKREFTMFSAFSFAVSISGLMATIATTFAYPLVAGGSASVVWCWLISGAGCLCIAFSVAEIVSAYPTSGGLYYACSKLVPEEWAPVVCWIDGWINLLGQIAGVASTDYGCASLLLAAVTMSTDGEYVPTNAHTVGTMAAILVFHGLLNSFPTKYMEKMTNTYVVFHLGCLIAGAVALLVKTENKNSASYVFTHVEANSGWNPAGFSFLFGFLSVSWAMTDYDATAHICEEMKEPERKAPWAISMAMIFTYVAGFLYNIVLCFCMGDPADLLTSSQPVAEIYFKSLGKRAGIFFTVVTFIILNFVGVTALQSASRTTWAQARDKMLPGSKIWYAVNKTTNTPLYAVWMNTAVCIALNLIALGSTTAINAIFNVTAIALDWSYILPIVGKVLFPHLFKRGPWNLGRWSLLVNMWAIIWTVFASVIFFLPVALPVTAANMNYAVVIFVGIIALSGVFWHLGGKNSYQGPQSTAVDPTMIVHDHFSDEKSNRSE